MYQHTTALILSFSNLLYNLLTLWSVPKLVSSNKDLLYVNTQGRSISYTHPLLTYCLTYSLGIFHRYRFYLLDHRHFTAQIISLQNGIRCFSRITDSNGTRTDHYGHVQIVRTTEVNGRRNAIYPYSEGVVHGSPLEGRSYRFGCVR